MSDSPRRNHIGTISLLFAAGGAVICQVLRHAGPWAGATWLDFLSAGFDAALVGGLADWFAVSALFRHPFGLPIPHTAIIPTRRAKIVESIVSMVQDEWLAPEVITTRLAHLSPSQVMTEWLHDPAHTARLGAPLRDFMRAVARMLNEPEVAEFVDRTLRRQLRDVEIGSSAGRWLIRVCDSPDLDTTFRSAAQSMANLAARPDTTAALEEWLDRAALQLHADGKRLVPMLLRRKVVQRKLVESACDYAVAELSLAATQTHHPLRGYVFGLIRSFGERLANSDADALGQVEQLRNALVESLEVQPIVAELLGRVQRQLDEDLQDDDGYLGRLIDRQVERGASEWLADPARRESFDRWVRSTVEALVRRHHHQIGVTVRENLEALDTATLVRQIEDRVGGDLQYIRLNGAVVGGLIGMLLALLHRLLP